MKQWTVLAALVMGASLACAAVAQSQAPAPRKGTVVDIKPDRIYLLDVASAGSRLVAVGERGFALLSDDAGKSWRAVGTPVVRTLTAVAFQDSKLGVAVGHGGSLVRTEDAGDTWTEVPMDEAAGDSLLGVTALGGGKFIAYGAFGMYFESVDGGRTWTRRMLLSEEFEAHISQVVPVGGVLWLVGETGTLARSEDGGATYTAVPSPYTGSYFGMVVAKDGALVIYGMRGSVYRSEDAGATWLKIETGTTATFNGGRVLSDGRIMLVGNAGLVATSSDNGRSFSLAWSPASKGFSAVIEVPGGLVAVGEDGAGALDTGALTKK
jgi:photosystem II stability/assembly factor-like uncharacterized protein